MKGVKRKPKETGDLSLSCYFSDMPRYWNPGHRAAVPSFSL